MKNTEEFLISYFHKDYALTKNEYLEISNNLLKNDNFFKNDKIEVLQKFFNDLKYINEQLEPLRKLGIPANIDLCGGAARDFILNQHDKIKDLDIMISVPTVPYSNHIEQVQTDFVSNDKSIHRYHDLSSNITKERLLSVGFTEEEINLVDWENPANLKINQLIQLCFLRSGLIEETFFHKIDSQGKITFDKYSYGQFKTITTDDKLNGVIKLNNTKTNYNIDLLITHKTRKEFLRGFDFNICKTSFEIINNKYNLDFPKDHTELKDRFDACFEFFADVKFKKMIFRLNEIPQEEIIRSAQRFVRLKDKYPEYEYVLDYWPDNLQSIKNKEIFEKGILTFSLDKQLSNKETKRNNNNKI